MPIGNLRNQWVTYWTMGALRGDGYTAFATPVSVKGRWEEREVLVSEGPDAERLSSNSRLYLAVDLPQGTKVILGKNASPTPPVGARKVIRTVNIPSIDGKKAEKVHYLD